MKGDVVPPSGVTQDDACGVVFAEITATEYKIKPHAMGKQVFPTFTLRPNKGMVRFSEQLERYSESRVGSDQWEFVTSELYDTNGDVRTSRYFEKGKTKRERITVTVAQNDSPVENDRNSTLNSFVARGLAVFLKLQVDVILELENNYGCIDVEMYEDPLTDEGETFQDAYWNYIIEVCDPLLGGNP